MEETIKKYSNGEITIVWKPGTCIHSTICWKGRQGLSAVFDPRVKPWIKPMGAATDEIISQVNKCPSGALSFYYDEPKQEAAEETMTETKIEVLKDGPLLVHGHLHVEHSNGQTETKDKVTAFCRCGKSVNKPYCDGSHTREGFTG